MVDKIGCLFSPWESRRKSGEARRDRTRTILEIVRLVNMGRLFLSRESRLKCRVVPKLGSGSTPVPLKPKFGTRRGVNGRILKLVVLGSASCSF